MTDIVGLYMDPPEGAVVLCVDEKSQVQALDRTQPLLPMTFGKQEKLAAPDYVRHGTTTLFAALDVDTGEVTASCHRQHRAVEFLNFLDTVEDKYRDRETLWSWTTSRRIRRPRSRNGSPSTRTSISTSPRSPAPS